ncbi:MAG TPA: DUF4421 family protein [Cyclobacteriaceae bacterium]|nr:DUF4421 family protein [Cyclobacteriaceae bacterium]
MTGLKIGCGLAFYLGIVFTVAAQTSTVIEAGVHAPDDADSLFVLKFDRINDFRVVYGTQGSSLGYGTKKEGTRINTAVYNNVVDLVGFGFTYKWIDLDFGFSLPRTTLQDVGLQNLSQFKFAGSFTSRKFMVRGYYLTSSGIIAEDQEGKFKSNPDINVDYFGIQYTYCFNFMKYSLRAAAVHYELQRRSAGSFLIRAEPFYRRVGIGSNQLVPAQRNMPSLFGEQTDLKYTYAPGMLIMPGFGYTWAMKGGKFFLAPMIFFGTGFAVNTYKGTSGEHTSMNTEWSGSAAFNMGYNGPRVYVALRSSYEMRYFLLDPSYFTLTDLKVNVTVGYRFYNLEKFIPEKLF